MADVVLVTGRVMPHGPEGETALLVEALRQRGVDATIEPWGTKAASQGSLVVIRTTWDYTERCAEFLDWARQTAATTRLVNPIEVLEWNCHKSYLLDIAYAGVPGIPTIIVSRGAAVDEQRSALEEYTGPVVIKPAISVGAIGTARVEAASVAASSHLAALVDDGDALVQPYLPGVTEGEVSLIYFGGEFSHAVRKVPAPGDYRVQIFHGGTVHPHAATEAERAVGTAALLTAPAPVAYARVDLVSTAYGPVLMELELIEPQLFLDAEPAAPARFANQLIVLLLTP
jgi:glutathione synthase/RimK-type ligase-like ATP-grasp enzyme